MLRFYMDHHVHGGITAGLRRRGIDCLTLHEDQSHRLDDEVVLSRATQLGRVLVTQDEDFFAITHRWQTAAQRFSGIVYSDQLGVTIGRAVQDIELIAHVMTEQEYRKGAGFSAGSDGSVA